MNLSLIIFIFFLFIGIKALNTAQQNSDMNELCYEKVLNFVRKGHQVMVFVHARNATSKTAMALLGMFSQKKVKKHNFWSLAF